MLHVKVFTVFSFFVKLDKNSTKVMTFTRTNLYIPWSEEKLSVKVRFLYDVHICNDYFSSITTQSHHRPVLQHLTSNCTGPNLLSKHTFFITSNFIFYDIKLHWHWSTVDAVNQPILLEQNQNPSVHINYCKFRNYCVDFIIAKNSTGL